MIVIWGTQETNTIYISWPKCFNFLSFIAPFQLSSIFSFDPFVPFVILWFCIYRYIVTGPLFNILFIVNILPFLYIELQWQVSVMRLVISIRLVTELVNYVIDLLLFIVDRKTLFDRVFYHYLDTDIHEEHIITANRAIIAFSHAFSYEVNQRQI